MNRKEEAKARRQARQGRRCEAHGETRPAAFCDEPATHVYHGIGGDLFLCGSHADYLNQVWGPIAKPIKEEENDDLPSKI